MNRKAFAASFLYWVDFSHGNTVVIFFSIYVLIQEDTSWFVKNWMHNSIKLYKCSHFSSSKAIYGCFLTRAKRYPLHEMFEKNNYYDPLKIFLELSLNRIDFFKGLSKHIKNDWIFNMRSRTLEVNSLLYEIDTNSEEMYII